MKAEQKMIHIKSQLGISVESTGTGTERPAGGVTSKHMPQMDVTVVMHVSALDNIIQISIVTAHRDGAHLCWLKKTKQAAQPEDAFDTKQIPHISLIQLI